MHVTVANNTNFPILLDGTLFQPGKYKTMPATPIEPGKFTAYEVAGGGFGGGVSGGNAWLVVLDDDFESVTWSFATGWVDNGAVHPPIQKAGVAESKDPKAGNSAATPEGNSITSTDTFKDKDGQSIKFTASVMFDETQTAQFTVDTIPA